MRLLLTTSLLLAASATAALAQTAPAAAAPKAPAAKPAAPKRAPGLYGVISTSVGDITVKFYEKQTPVTVKNFVDLALGRKTYTNPENGLPVRKPFYNGLTFHRVIPGFMIQGGDPLGNGSGGTSPIPDEFDPALTFDVPGRLAMANAGPNTGSCQFFLTEVPTPHLNGLHTIFGQVVEGQERVNEIARTPVANDKPVTPVEIVKITIKREGVAAGAAKPAGAVKPGAAKPAAVKPAGAKPAAAKPAAAASKK
ncbi:MAG: peptidylprolyl isomerase [Acidobacteriia bacterium]|nr:peptidylprolyl isomerase [Terriglobia bacterium]